MDPRDLAKTIDQSLLKPEATMDDVRQTCEEARRFGFGTVCVNPAHIKLCATLLRGSPVKVCSVVGFPLGATLPEVKAFEARECLRLGAREIDMVINVGTLKSRDYALVKRDIEGVVNVCHGKGAICKVIIETALLTEEEKVKACTLAKEAGADFVKTSTGFGPRGATVKDVALMRRVVGPGVGVKAAGGVRTYSEAIKMIEAGATRIGTSAGGKIMEEALASSN
mgnify:CR=1 FL=1